MSETKRCLGPCARDLPLAAFWLIRNRRGERVARPRCKQCLMAEQRAPHRRAAVNRHQRRRRRAGQVALGLVEVPRRWWPVLRVSAEIGCSRSQVYNLIARGQVAARKELGTRQWKIDPASVAALLAAQEAA